MYSASVLQCAAMNAMQAIVLIYGDGCQYLSVWRVRLTARQQLWLSALASDSHGFSWQNARRRPFIGPLISPRGRPPAPPRAGAAVAICSYRGHWSHVIPTPAIDPSHTSLTSPSHPIHPCAGSRLNVLPHDRQEDREQRRW